MRVLVTGGTGYVGSHTVRALTDAGHDVRLLVRSITRLDPAMRPLGLEPPACTVGDVTDPTAVRQALAGCDAVVHAANVFSQDVRRAAEVLRVNDTGTRLVLETAHELGLDPIVHVSSAVALLPPREERLGPDSPVGSPPGAYARSKVAAERIARDLQERNAPVVIVYPGGIFGPHDPHLGEVAKLLRNQLRGLLPTTMRGHALGVDVRDVAAVHAAVLEPARGPRRYLAVSGRFTIEGLLQQLRELTGRRLPSVTLPTSVALATARASDRVQRWLPLRLPIDWEGAWIMAADADADASVTAAQLGISFRPLRDSVADTVRWLYAAGHVTRRQAGRLASEAAGDAQGA
jgi:dihydroflavonol-4-reductase